MEEGTAFKRNDYEEILARLRHNAGGWQQLIITTNPAGPLHWIYTDLLAGKQASVHLSSADDNTHNPQAYRATLARLTGAMHDRLVKGLWVQNEGAVYNNFDISAHVLPRELSEFKRFFLAIDEGYTNPAVILLIGVDADDRWHVCREFYERGVLQERVVSLAVEWFNLYHCEAAAVDAAAAGLIADLQHNHISAHPAKGRVLDGIQAVQNRLQLAGDNRPRLTIAPECENLLSEFTSYTWKPEKDAPIKENDHALDALRYFGDYFGNGAPNWSVYGLE
jgi:phage terminase large subunit